MVGSRDRAEQPATALDPTIPEGDDMTRETYRGVKLTARKLTGRDYGRCRTTVGGQPFGDWIGADEARILRVIRWPDVCFLRQRS